MRTYHGKFITKNSNKYIGTLPIIYRSSWELALMKWCDENSNVIKWGSESVIVPYLCQIDNKYHRYFVDFIIEFKNKGTYLIEVKPKSKTSAPKLLKRHKSSQKYLNECLEYVQNENKWMAAKKFASERNMIFKVWTEDTLKELGILIIK